MVSMMMTKIIVMTNMPKLIMVMTKMMTMTKVIIVMTNMTKLNMTMVNMKMRVTSVGMTKSTTIPNLLSLSVMF